MAFRGSDRILSVMEWLKDAFAIEAPGPAKPTEAQRLFVDRLCREIVRRRMSTPAQLLLEMGRPAQLCVGAAHALLSAISDGGGPTGAAYDQLSSFLEQRGSIEYISGRLEAVEAEGAERNRSPETR